MRRKDLKPYFPIAMREADYKYIANVVPLKEGQEPAWKPPFDFELKDIRY